MEKSMDHLFGHLLTRLGGDSLSFPHPAEDLKTIQTHISIVLLAGDFAYKIKKPARFPFLDYSTLKKRSSFCHLELELNRRLSEKVYLSVVPITREGRQLTMEGQGPAVEYAVKMARLPDENRLGYLLEKGSLPGDFWKRLASRLARFYREASRGRAVSKWASFASIQEDWDEVFSQLESFPPEILEPALREKLRNLAHEGLRRHQNQIEKRALHAREGHGDLRLEHIYFFPGKPEPEDLAVIDCVEFNPRYRCCDPLLDIAFLAMDLETSGFHRESRDFIREFLKAAGDVDEDHLLDFYSAYRHLVRGLVRGLQAQEMDASPPEKEKAKIKSKRHFQLALRKLIPPGRRPCLVLLGGLPGTGKSTLSHQLNHQENFLTFSSDLVRKELTGLPPDSKPGAGFEKGLYEPERTEKTYDALLRETETALHRGERVLVDASFWRQSWRDEFLRIARDLNVPFFFFVCRISQETAEQRLSEARDFGSDADLDIYRKMAVVWEAPSPALRPFFLNTERPLEISLAEVHRILEEQGLAAERVMAVKP